MEKYCKPLLFCSYMLVTTITLSIYKVYSASSVHPVNKSKYEFFTAASDMELLHKVEMKLASKFLDYYKEEEERLDKLEKHLQVIEKRLPQETGYIDDDEYWVSHPTDGYGILKAFDTFWPNFGNFSKTNSTKNTMLKLRSDLIKLKRAYPEEDDLRGALAALFRIQDTYDMTPTDFIEGLGNYSHKLTVEEMFEMGFLCTGIEDYYHARKWLKEAYYRFPPGITQVGFLDKASLVGEY